MSGDWMTGKGVGMRRYASERYTSAQKRGRGWRRWKRWLPGVFAAVIVPTSGVFAAGGSTGLVATRDVTIAIAMAKTSGGGGGGGGDVTAISAMENREVASAGSVSVLAAPVARLGRTGVLEAAGTERRVLAWTAPFGKVSRYQYRQAENETARTARTSTGSYNRQSRFQWRATLMPRHQYVWGAALRHRTEGDGETADDHSTESAPERIAPMAASTRTDYDDIDIASVTVTESSGAECTAESAAVSAYTGTGIVEDCNTLLDLRDEIRGTARLNWSADMRMEDWDGIKINKQQVSEVLLEHRVWDVELERFRLDGSIPAALGSLSLRILNLTGNQLSGSIPKELGGLSNLRSLSLGENQLSGSIPPELGSLSNLEYLYLQENQLSGSIPPELGSLSKLEYLYLGKIN